MSQHIKQIGPDELSHYLEQIGANLNTNTSLTLMGSGPNILHKCVNPDYPDEYVTTIDIDCWRKTSVFNYDDLKQACEKAGLVFNPLDFEEPNQPYLQIVEEGVAYIPDHKPKELNTTGKLTVSMPPAADLISSKLLRGSLKDVKDCGFLTDQFDVKLSEVKKSIRKMPHNKKIIAEENLTLLEVYLKQNKSSTIEL